MGPEDSSSEISSVTGTPHSLVSNSLPGGLFAICPPLSKVDAKYVKVLQSRQKAAASLYSSGYDVSRIQAGWGRLSGTVREENSHKASWKKTVLKSPPILACVDAGSREPCGEGT